jgi:hypothetical protein
MNHVYFMKPIGLDGPIKIGCSHRPKDRLIVFMAWSPIPLEIIAHFPGTLQIEKKIHDCFADHHLHSEWFRASPKLIKAISLLKAGVPVEQAIDLTDVRGNLRIHRRHRFNGWKSSDIKKYHSILEAA